MNNIKSILILSVLVFLCACTKPKYSEPDLAREIPEGAPTAPGSYAMMLPDNVDQRDEIIRQQTELIQLLQARIKELERGGGQ